MTVSEIFEIWQRPSHIMLHAGEMTAEELRCVRAVVKAVQAEVTAALSEQVVVPKEPTEEMLIAGVVANQSRMVGDVYRAMIAAVPASAPVRSL